MNQHQDLLEQGEIEITHRLVDASNATLLGVIEDLGKVIYKPIAGERPLWDFPHGSLADREVAAYKLNRYLGLDLIPETVIRDGPFGPGMVQRWIDVDEQMDLISYAQGKDPQLRLLALYDAIVNNTDRKFGHILIDPHGKLFGCDHGVTFHEEDKLRTVLWQFAADEFMSDEVNLLERASRDRSKISEMLRSHLTEEEIEAIFVRIDRLTEAGRFPTPREGWPAVPWPPV